MIPIISDAGPIISFARANRLFILQQVIQAVIIPEAVYEDIVVKGKGKSGSKEIEKGKWSEIVALKNKKKAEELPHKLGAGEREAIVLTQEIDDILLMDDPDARKEAKKQGVLLVSSLDVIEEAKAIGLIKKGKTLLDELIAAGFRLKHQLYRDFLIRIKEF